MMSVGLWKWDYSDYMSPRVSVLYDIFGDQKHIAKFSYGVFTDTTTTRILEFFLSEGGYAYRRHGWIGDETRAATEAELHDPANWEFQTEQSPESNPMDFDPNIEPNSNQRFTLEYNWQINPDQAFTLRYVQSETDDMLEDVATFEYSAAEGEAGYDPTEEGEWYWQLINFPLKERSYKAIDMILSGQVGSLLNYNVAYTWSDSQGTNPGEFETATFG